jgi:hypothetical protein
VDRNGYPALVDSENRNIYPTDNTGRPLIKVIDRMARRLDIKDDGSYAPIEHNDSEFEDNMNDEQRDEVNRVRYEEVINDSVNKTLKAGVKDIGQELGKSLSEALTNNLDKFAKNSGTSSSREGLEPNTQKQEEGNKNASITSPTQQQQRVPKWVSPRVQRDALKRYKKNS